MQIGDLPGSGRCRTALWTDDVLDGKARIYQIAVRRNMYLFKMMQ
ncbi:Uncharacterised protein [Mycobacteroides abscessus]|nr:Uncharacterised protein [Mycobacteroides abscessus]SKY97841.1 Uncharacterised protein [Mycobacteroides abscessus subsp. massiliense]